MTKQKPSTLQAAKGADTLAKLKKQMEDKERQAKEAVAEKARKEAEFRASIGMSTDKKKQAHTPAHNPSSTSTNAGAAGKGTKPTIEVWRPDLDKEMFSVAMHGVEKLSEKKAGPASRVKPASPSARADKTASRARRAHAEGGEKIAVRWPTEDRCEAARKGAEFALEALQRFSDPQESLDLHGLESVEARTHVAEFVRSRRARGLRVVEVVHGVGRNSPDGYSVLRDATVAALSDAPGSREIDAFCSTERGASVVIALRSKG